MITNVLEYLEATQALLPDKVAFSDGRDSLTFAQTYRTARLLGSALLERGLCRQPVLLLMARHPLQIAAFFGVIYAGCSYVPLDAEMPEARMELIAATCTSHVLLYDKKNEKKALSMPFDGLKLCFEDVIACEVNETLLAEVREEQLDIDPIYMVFTSGSTGVPKGVAACHRSVIDYAENLTSALPFDRDTVFGNQTPLYFDAPLKEILPTIKLGCTMILIPRMNFLFPGMLCQFIVDQKINTVCWVVSALTMISSLGALETTPPTTLRLVAFGSEVFPRAQYDLWRAALPDAEFYNLYGPTEATGMSCYWHADRELSPDEPIPVGRPFRNTQVLLLDKHKRPVPDGKEGEIYLRGTCVTLGYYNNPEKTKASFVKNPLQGAYPEYIYRTGDIGKRNEYGELVFVCRRDAQIKHMGHRIELGEIEAAALRLPGIKTAVCVYDTPRKRIVLYYSGDGADTEARAGLSGLVPKYMLPAVCVRMDRLPQTPNGKLDRKKLKETAETSAE